MLHIDTESIMAVVMAAKWQEYYNDDLTTQEEKAATEELERVKLFLPHIESQETARQYEAALSAFIAGYKQGVELALSLSGLSGENLDAEARELAKTEADLTGGRARVGAKKS